jgi:hypothetical protein
VDNRLFCLDLGRHYVVPHQEAMQTEHANCKGRLWKRAGEWECATWAFMQVVSNAVHDLVRVQIGRLLGMLYKPLDS